MNRHFDTKLKKFFLSFILVATLAAGWIGFSFFSSEKDSAADLNYQKYFNENYRIFSLNIPAQISFAGEEVPLELLDVRERLDKELLINTYWQSQSLLFHKRANRWFPVIEPILKKNGVPDDFKYLAVIESGLENVVSPAGATGFWQLLKETGREYGLEINNEIDERYHVEKATEAACRYLKSAYRMYGSWTMAAASYNIGMAGLGRQVDRQQASNYYDLLLNSETGRYLFRILAVKEILSKPAQYGFHFRPRDLYPTYQTDEVEINSSVEDFAEFALQHEVNYKILKILNPWLRDSYLTNPSGNTYKIKLPKKDFDGLVPVELYPKAETESVDSILNDSIEIK